MTRLYWDLVKHMYTVLIWAKYCGRVNTANIYAEVYQWQQNGGSSIPEINNAVNNCRPGNGGPNIPEDEIVLDVAKKLAGMKNSQYEGDLIDTIVNLLQMPFHQNVLSGKGLKSLRNALLLPEESAGLLDRIKKIEMACFTCGKEIVPGEAVIFSANGAGSHSIQCMACGTPTTVKCANCATSVPFSERFSTKKGLKSACSGHRQEEKEASVAAAMERIRRLNLDNEVRPVFGRAAVAQPQPRQWVQAVVGPPPPAPARWRLDENAPVQSAMARPLGPNEQAAVVRFDEDPFGLNPPPAIEQAPIAEEYVVNWNDEANDEVDGA